MNEPIRLREERGSDLERALLKAGMSYRASATTRAKALAALGLAGSTTIVVGHVSAATVTSLVKVTFAKVVAAVSLAGAVAVVPVGYYAWQRQDSRQDKTASTRPDGKGRVVSRAPAKVVEPAPVATEEDPPAATPRAAVPAVVASRGGPSVARTPKPESRFVGANASLTRELAMLDAARSTLANGQTGSTLSLLDTYSRDFPHGRLGVEAEVLRIDALAASGRGAAAKKHAEAFVRRYPGSVFAQRVRGYLGN